MSLDYSLIPASIEQESRQYAEARHITAEEAFVEIFTEGLKAKRSKVEDPELLTDEMINNR